MTDELLTHYASRTDGLVGDIQPRVACGTQHWAVVSEHPHQVNCPDCRKVIVARQFDIARLAVLKARACWAEWASDQCKDADGNWLPGSDDLWRSLIAADFAASGAEAHLEAAIAHVTGQSPLALVQPAAEALEAARRQAAGIPGEPEDECEGAPADPPVTDLGYLSLPAEVQAAIEAGPQEGGE